MNQIQCDAVRMLSIPEFTVTESHILRGSLPCFWCEHQIDEGEFALIVKEEDHADAFAMHLNAYRPTSRRLEGWFSILAVSRKTSKTERRSECSRPRGLMTGGASKASRSSRSASS